METNVDRFHLSKASVLNTVGFDFAIHFGVLFAVYLTI